MSMSMRDTIHQSISRSNRNTAIISIIALAIAVAAFALSTSKFVFSYFGDPVVLTEESLLATNNDSLPLFKVTATGEEMFDTEMYEETTTTRNGVSTGTSTTAYFGFLTLGEHLLLVKTPGMIQESLVNYEGVLTPVSADEVALEVYNEYMTEYPELEGVVVPQLLDTGYETTPWFLGAAAEAVLALGGLFGLATVAMRRNPNNHPIIKRMARFGDAETVMSEIDNEMLQGQIAQVDKLQFTRSWVVYKSGNDMQFLRLNDVMWAYKHIVSRNGVKTYSAYVWDRSGQLLNVVSSEKNVDAMIIAVLQRAPWAIAGYNKDVEKSWNKERASFVQTVDDRRNQMMRQQ